MCVSPLLEVNVTMKDACSPKPVGTFMLIVCALDLVSRVKELVAETLKVEELPADGQVTYKGRVLDDGEELSACGITNGAALSFVFGGEASKPQASEKVVHQFGSTLEAVAEEVEDEAQRKSDDLEDLLASVRKLRAIEKMVDDIDRQFSTPPSTDADTSDQESCGSSPRLDQSGQMWVKRESRSKPGRFYWGNAQTGQTVWKEPKF